MKLRMRKVLTISLSRHLQMVTQFWTSRILFSRLQADSGNKSHQPKAPQSNKRSLPGRQVAWMIYDFAKVSGDNDAILDLRLLSQVQSKNDNVQAFGTRWNEVLSAVIDRPIDNIWASLYKMHIEKSEELKYLLQVHAQESTLGDKK